MWFLFGLLTLLGFIGLSAYYRIEARWRGTQRGHGEHAHEYHQWSNKQKVIGFRIGVPARADLDFALKPETRTDRFFKAIGLSREHQMNDAAFDRAAYLVSDDAGLCARLAASPALRADFHDVLAHGGKGSYTYAFKRLRCAGGRMWVEYRTRKGFESGHVDELARWVVPALRRAALDLQGIPAEARAGWRDPFVLKAVVILAVSSGLAINGVVQLLRMGWSHMPFTESPGALLAPAFVAGGVLVAALAAAAIAFLGRTARAHLVLLEVLLVGGFGAVATAYAEVRDINMEWDRSAGQVHEVAILDKRVSRGRRSTSYYLRLQPWPGHPGSGEVRVSRDAYDWFRVKERVQVHVRPGWLGHRWVSSISSMEKR